MIAALLGYLPPLGHFASQEFIDSFAGLNAARVALPFRGASLTSDTLSGAFLTLNERGNFYRFWNRACCRRAKSATQRRRPRP